MTISEHTLRTQVIEAMLNHVPFDGWSKESMTLAAADCGVDAEGLTRLFPAGIEDALIVYLAYADAKMLATFKERHQGEQIKLPVHLRIRSLIMIRLEHAAPHKEVVRRTLVMLARPQHAKLAAKMLYRTTDAMWRAAGDTSTDYNFYTKRATLSALYSSTVLAFLADNTPDMTETEAFLDRRLMDISRIPKLTKPAKNLAYVAGRMAMRFFAGATRHRRAR